MANYTSSHTGAEIDQAVDKALESEIVSAEEKSDWNSKAAGNHNHDTAYAPKSHSQDGTIHVTASDKSSWNSKAAGSHNHGAGDITSGTLTVSRGGTGRSTLTSGYFLRGNGTGTVTLTSPSAVLSDIGAAPNVSSFKNAGYLGSYTSQSSLNSKLDSLKAENYGYVNNFICSLGVDFQATQPFGWAAGTTVLVNGGGDFCSQVLTGSTGIFHRQCNGGTWQPWKQVGGTTVLYDNTSGTTGTITLSQSAANFSHMRIYYRDTDNLYNSVDVYDPNGKGLWLSSAAIESYGTYFKRAAVQINANKITFTRNDEAFIKGSLYEINAGNYIYVTRVEAWN